MDGIIDFAQAARGSLMVSPSGIDVAEAGRHRWLRQTNEQEWDFLKRVRREAADLGISILTIHGSINVHEMPE